ncbi:MAG: ABC transporter permease subunit [Actinomycetota bacterium]|nr:ABC transporter permease subunit [Actinomycetota bacterium]
MAAVTTPAPEALAQARRAKRPRLRRVPWWHVLWLVVAALVFLVPLYSLFQFSFEGTVGHQPWYHWYQVTFDDGQFRSSFWLSIQISLEATAISVVLMVPTVFWVHLRLPRLRPIMELVSVLPFVIPPIVLIVGLLVFLRPLTFLIARPEVLALIYVIFGMPFMYRSLDAGYRAIDLRTLTEAAQNLGASTFGTLFRVIVPNLRSAILGGALLTVAISMGEYTVASLMQFSTFPVYMYEMGQEYAYRAASTAVLSLLLTWLAMLAIFLLGRGGKGAAQHLAAAK